MLKGQAMVARRMLALAIGAACTSCALILGYGDPVDVAPRGDSGSGGTADAVGIDSPGVDSGSDASVPFCPSLSPPPTFCSSFDEASYLSGWGGSDVVNGAIGRDTSTFTSAPASLRAAFAPPADGGTVNAAVSIDFGSFDSKPFTSKVGFDVRIEAAAPAGAFAVIGNALVVAGSGAPYLLQVVATPLADGASAALSLLEVRPGGGTVEHAATQGLTVDRWSHLEITVTIASLDTTGNAVKLVVDGKSAFDGPLVKSIGAGVPGATFGLSAVAGDTTAWALRYDNVTVDLH